MGLKENIKKYRRNKKMTLDDLAKSLGVNRATIQRYENGVISNIPPDKIELMAELLDTTPARLMGWEEDNNLSEEEINWKKVRKAVDGLSDEQIQMVINLSNMLKKN